jgi:signal transduction histidine kinase
MIRDAVSTAPPAGRRPELTRAGWLALCAAMLALFALGQWFLFFELQQPCDPPACADEMFYLSSGDIADLRASGFTTSFYASYQVALYIIFFLIHTVLATLIFWRRPNDRMARYAAFALLFWSATFPSTPLTLWQASPLAAWLMTAGAVLGGVFFYLFLFLFPDGQFSPRWMRWVAPGLALYPVISTLISTLGLSGLGAAAFETIRPYFFTLFIAGAIGTQIYRYRRVSNPAEREQTRWVFFGIVVGLSWILGVILAAAIVPALQHGAWGKMLVTTLIYAGFLMVPLSIGVAILRARLWDIDLLLSRTLLYAALTATVVGVYVLVVGYLSTLFQTSGSLVISLVATGLVAVLFQPLRARLQRGVNRLIYGERDDPYAALARLGQRLEGTLAPDAVLPTIVQTVAESLRLPYVAIALDQDGHCTTAAAVGTPASEAISLPLAYQGEVIGQLIVGPRTPGEPLTQADWRLLDDLLRQAGVAAHAVRLTSDLQHSRERLVAAREEERRRIRRDLHDGLGPQLASQTLTIDAVLRLLPTDPTTATALLQQLKGQSQAAIADIRRLVYALRPPALDDLGLIMALREQAAQYAQSAVRIAIVAPEPLPPLPAAVEVAVYRIVQEALTNVIKHSGARECRVEIALGEGLDVTVEDDGYGLPADRRAGVGLSSMEERAAELGGRLVVEPRPGGGTRVWANLPFPAQ